MRRFFSVLLFVVGGWILSGQLMVAFVDSGHAATNLTVLVMLLVFAAPFLLAGAWASPGRRWRDLGLTILITVGIACFTGFSMLLFTLDAQFMRAMPPMPDIAISAAAGLANMAAVAAVGFWLYRRGGKEAGPSTDRLSGDS